MMWLKSIFSGLSPWGMSRAWWVKIQAKNPAYTYYFGPFESWDAANERLPGYIEDLNAEQAKIACSTIEWCAPPKPTIEGSHQAL